MKLVILAAGKGKRMGASSEHTPKPILKYKGETLLHHKLKQIPSGINEIIVIIGHLGHKIVETLGHQYDNRVNGGNLIPITYIEQTELLGTADSLWRAKTHLSDESFLILMGDDLYAKADLEEMIKTHKVHSNAWVALVHPQDEHIAYGKCILDENGFLIDFRNDPEMAVSKNLMYTGACILTPEVFSLPMKKVGAVEYGLPQTFVQEERHKNAKGGARQDIRVVNTSFWKRITAPEDLED